MKFNNVQNKIIEMLNEYDRNDGILTKELLLKFSNEIKGIVDNNKAIEKEFVISYFVDGEIKVSAKDRAEAMRNFHDRCGFSNDDLYENLDHNFKISSIVEVGNE